MSGIMGQMDFSPRIVRLSITRTGMGKYWVATSHTATGDELPEEACPHFKRQASAWKWLRTRQPCEWCGRPVYEARFCSDVHAVEFEARYVAPRHRDGAK